MIRHNWLQIGASVVLSICLAGLAKGEDDHIVPLPAEKGEKKLSTFDYRSVTLDSGRMRAQMDEVCDEYLRIPNDDLLKGFRLRAGLPAPGNDLGGWYTSDTFHVFGQIVSGLSRLYATTGNAACREKANALLLEWSKCIEPDGYFFYTRKPNAPHYIYDKMLWGLLDAHLYCENKEALGYLSRITDWAVKNLEHTRLLGPKGHEWYTLSENLYRAYLITGDPKYRDFGRVWEYTEYWDMYGRKQDIFEVRPDGQQVRAYHAYSHVNTLGGAGAAYLVTGDPHYLAILKNAYDYLQANEVFATGGYGPSEQLLPHDKVVLKLANTPATFETQCGTWAVFKLVKYLQAFTGDARYGDWAERLAINGIGATIHMSADGHVFYYSDYRTSGGEKAMQAHGSWTCCTGTRPQAVADFCDLIYLKDTENLYVNLFAPSSIQWRHAGANVHLQQTTRFPEDGAVAFTIGTDQSVEFGLKIRSPGWLAEPMTVKLNGKPLASPVDEQHWCTVQRTWKNGDRLEVVLPMRLEVSYITPGQRYPAAIMYGPTVLAARATDPTFVHDLDLEHIDRELTPVPGDILTWRLVRNNNILLRPFYAYKEGERYYLYLEPLTAKQIALASIVYRPQWQGNGKFRFTKEIGATAEYRFEGTGIRWLGGRFDDAGKAEVSVDGKVVATVDQYGPGRNLPFQWEWRNLPPGKHTIRLRLIEEKSPQSKDHFINVAGFEVIHP